MRTVKKTEVNVMFMRNFLLEKNKNTITLIPGLFRTGLSPSLVVILFCFTILLLLLNQQELCVNYCKICWHFWISNRDLVVINGTGKVTVCMTCVRLKPTHHANSASSIHRSHYIQPSSCVGCFKWPCSWLFTIVLTCASVFFVHADMAASSTRTRI